MIKRAIFIGGCVRSGTTLRGAMLGAPADCAGVPESQFKAQLLKDPRLVTPESIHAVLANHWRFKLWDLPLTVGDLPLNGADAERPARVMRRITSSNAGCLPDQWLGTALSSSCWPRVRLAM